MTDDRFWQIIADSRRDFDPARRDGNMDLQVRRLTQLLLAMPLGEVQAFDRVFGRYYFAAYRYDLWGAGFIIGEGCSDDSFMDFRYWLISMGREVYEAAMADPESLADVAGRPGVEACFFEEFGGVVGEVLERKGAPELPPDPSRPRHPREAAGEPWEEDELPQRFPKLWAKFGEGGA